ncbi:MAG: type II toxin-antitoxin system HipA family toxin [gamma proteobacterium symbiont of Bathyaustriella thionipta]|nr:type II toxin-antitoxin system HipA family toxin [gamma proteobacterium symbiont of Bathyaustriella thionipta]MCU7949273.1 type II toxin-antitoxin system HipA family toxin [gamma proteobacterium symbiont of Bathyaustriella thionipta]MCU7954413.1 type II toxin-antitoxin system HipA family toxin [gamma proteobacterium symbiont of Bathyaustriella thionipta]MCU7955866.1 type II toxin-antitoxin system HipA family toxin [gamma proteobacterium symbiont of Bathyaustriella thionipta]MCU7967546.1 type
MVNHNLAEVRLWGELVGAIAYDDTTHYCTFEYHPQWIAKGIEISPLHLPLGPKKYRFLSLPFETFKGLPAVFADTLPDDFGNALIDAWLARNGRNKSSFTALELLLYTGSRGMGAIEYAPVINKDLNKSSIIELNSLLKIVQRILDERSSFIETLPGDIAGDAREEALMAMLQVGTSAGGARPKAVIGINQERTVIRSGQVDLPEGFEHYLLKFDGVVEHSQQRETFGDPQGYGRMEYAYYLMAKEAGIHMMPSELLEDGPRAHFMTQRFDRIGNRKIHYQSLCAMDHADYKKPGEYSYEQIFTVMRSLRLKRSEGLEMFRRMVFNIVARNHDDHTKNIGFTLNSDFQWELSPAFDVAFSYKKDSPWVNSHQLSINSQREHFSRSDLLVVAGTFLKEANHIIDEVTETVSRWSDFAHQASVPKSFANQIQSMHRLSL